MKLEDIAQDLIRYDTVSPVESPKIFEFLKGVLEEEGVKAEIREIGGVFNLVAETGSGNPSICLNGHLDVVEPEGEWSSTDPFKPKIEDGTLYGRGAADMKAAFAAQLKAFLDLHRDSNFDGRIVLMAVGDEEIGGFNGSKPLVEEYYSKGEGFDYALVGEATDLDVQVGTRGVLWLNVKLEGEGIHASRAHLAEMNVMQELSEVLEKLNNLELDYVNEGSLPDPSAEVTRIETTKTYNSVPGEMEIGMDIRYLPSQNIEEIVKQISEKLEGVDCGMKVEVQEDHGGAFEVQDERFRKVAVESVKEVRDKEPDEITEGGASDGRFFAEKGTPFIELGVNQRNVHAENENSEIENLRKLRKAYYKICKKIAVENEKAE
jgi:succinyl-diaminopimelate desuccinylase